MATFDMSIIVLQPSGPEVRHEVDNQRFARSQDLRRFMTSTAVRKDGTRFIVLTFGPRSSPSSSRTVIRKCEGLTQAVL